jgi:hypothetical protein
LHFWILIEFFCFFREFLLGKTPKLWKQSCSRFWIFWVFLPFMNFSELFAFYEFFCLFCDFLIRRSYQNRAAEFFYKFWIFPNYLHFMNFFACFVTFFELFELFAIDSEFFCLFCDSLLGNTPKLSKQSCYRFWIFQQILNFSELFTFYEFFCLFCDFWLGNTPKLLKQSCYRFWIFWILPNY